MTDAVFMRVKGNYFMPVDNYAEQLLHRCKIGDGITVKAKKNPNVKFHRKLFGLFNLGFTMWEPVGKTHNGQPIQKHFDRFREEILILAGHYDVVFNLDGTFRMTAKSISFAKCDDLERERVYKSVLSVLWDRILREKHFESEADVERAVAQLMAYE